MRIALFSDIHGHLRVLLHCLRCWQISNREYLDLAVVPGDLGCFPDEAGFDSATKRHVEKNPEEAGFARYFVEPDPSVEEMFAPLPHLDEFSEVRCPVLFVAGNHEDYGFLRQCAGAAPRSQPAFPVDCYGRFLCLRDGQIYELRDQKGGLLRISGLWGIEQAQADKPYAINLRTATSLLSQSPGSIDLFLTHDAPLDVWQAGSGSETISEILGTLQPAVHVFGHVKPNEGQRTFQVPGSQTQSWLLENLTFGKSGNNNLAGAMAILDWKHRSDWRVDLVEEAWLKAMNGKTWRKTWPDPFT